MFCLGWQDSKPAGTGSLLNCTVHHYCHVIAAATAVAYGCRCGVAARSHASLQRLQTVVRKRPILAAACAYKQEAPSAAARWIRRG